MKTLRTARCLTVSCSFIFGLSLLAGAPLAAQEQADDAGEAQQEQTELRRADDDPASTEPFEVLEAEDYELVEQGPHQAVLVSEGEHNRRGNADIWTLAGVSVASLGGSLGFFLASDSTGDELAATTGTLLFDRSERIRLGQKEESQRNMGWILLGTGAASGIGAIWLSIDRAGERHDAQVSIQPANFGRRPGIMVRGRW